MLSGGERVKNVYCSVSFLKLKNVHTKQNNSFEETKRIDIKSERCCLWQRKRSGNGSNRADGFYKYAKENELNQQYVRSVISKLNFYLQI